MINIRESIKSNFKELNESDIKHSIIESIKTNDEIILPGLGVFFEILWNNSNDEYRNYILSTLKKHLS